jgi:hypothetical protein
MGRTACTEPQCLYSIAIPLLPLWVVRPVQSLSAYTRVTFTFLYIYYITITLFKNKPHLSTIIPCINIIKVKVKVTLEQATKAQRGEQRYSSTLSLTSALDGVGVQSHALAALPPRKTRYPLYRRLGGPHSRSGRVRKISPPPGFDPRPVQSLARAEL